METKKACSSVKRIVTKRINKISGLMNDERNTDEVLKKSAELGQAFKKFQDVHVVFHRQLEDPLSIEESGNYFESVLNQLQENVNIWLAGIEASNMIKSMDFNPEDSVSNVDSHSVTSRSSHKLCTSRTSTASSRARAAAKRAILKAEVATLK